MTDSVCSITFRVSFNAISTTLLWCLFYCRCTDRHGCMRRTNRWPEVQEAWCALKLCHTGAQAVVFCPASGWEHGHPHVHVTSQYQFNSLAGPTGV